MMSAATINRLNQEAAVAAATANKVPFELTQQDLDTLAAGDLRILQQIPLLGDYIPAGYIHCDLTERGLEGHHAVFGDCRFFVDKSGFGTDAEPALTAERLASLVAAHLRPGDCLALTNEGQFQIHVDVYVRDPDAEAQGISTCKSCGDPCIEDEDECDACNEGLCSCGNEKSIDDDYCGECAADAAEYRDDSIEGPNYSGS